MGTAPLEVDEEDDDWNPPVKPGLVLRPHLLQWTSKPSEDLDMFNTGPPPNMACLLSLLLVLFFFTFV